MFYVITRKIHAIRFQTGVTPDELIVKLIGSVACFKYVKTKLYMSNSCPLLIIHSLHSLKPNSDNFSEYGGPTYY